MTGLPEEGMAAMQVMGGRFRSVMPSDLFKPGAMARESLRAPGRDYASSVNREELQRLMRRWALTLSVQSHKADHAFSLIWKAQSRLLGNHHRSPSQSSSPT